MTIDVPVSIGDIAYVILTNGDGKDRVVSGQISNIGFSNDMRLLIRLKGRHAAEWGVRAFRTRAEAERAIGTRSKTGRAPVDNAKAAYTLMIEYIQQHISRTKKKVREIAEECAMVESTASLYINGDRSGSIIRFLSILEAVGIDTFGMFCDASDKAEEETQWMRK